MIVDRYSEVLVIQVVVVALQRNEDEVLAALMDVLGPRTMLERAPAPVRHHQLIVKPLNLSRDRA